MSENQISKQVILGVLASLREPNRSSQHEEANSRPLPLKAQRRKDE
jgi:hypothetical protein